MKITDDAGAHRGAPSFVFLVKGRTTSLLVSILFLVVFHTSHILRADSKKSAVLDRVVAVVGDQAILASDVDEEMRFTVFQPAPEPAADNTPPRALNRVIDRTLIDQQRLLQTGLAQVSPQQVAESIVDLRKTIPACIHAQCETAAGWKEFLSTHGFTESELEDHVRERLEILKFIDLRFGVAARVPNADVQKYYEEVLKPELERDKAAVPSLSSVAPRIREILRQQQVSDLVDQWIKGLRSEANVRILDSAYREGGTGQ